MAQANKSPRRAFKNRPKSAESSGVSKWLFWLLAVAMFGFGVWFVMNYDWVSKGIRYTQKKSNNPYEAASLILAQENKTVNYSQGLAGNRTLSKLWQGNNNAQTTLILKHIADEQADDLDTMLAWVQAGGHIITFSDDVLYDADNVDIVNAYLSDENPLLVKLGVYRVDKPIHEATYANNYELVSATPLYLPNNRALIITNEPYFFDTSKLSQTYPQAVVAQYDFFTNGMLEGVSDKLLQARKQQFGLTDTQIDKFKSAYKFSPHLFDDQKAMVDMQFGQGRITILSDSTLFDSPMYGYKSDERDDTTKDTAKGTKNSDNPDSIFWQKMTGDYKTVSVYQDGIARLDNAYLLSFLTTNRSQIYFVDNFKEIGLIDRLREHTPFLLIGIMLLAMAGVLSLPRQFGRTQAIYDDSAYDMMRYFKGVANFLYKGDKMAVQVAKNRANLLDRLAVSVPSLTNLKNQQAIIQAVFKDAHLKDNTITIDMVYLALFGTWDNDSEFLAVTQAFVQLARCYVKR